MSKFYSNVKNKVKSEEGEGDEDSGSAPSGGGSGNASFDQLIESVEETDTDEEEPDNTEIEDISGKGGSGKDYSDPKKIELNSSSTQQAGKDSDSAGPKTATSPGTSKSKSPSKPSGAGNNSSKNPLDSGNEVKNNNGTGSPASDGRGSVQASSEVMEDIRDQNKEIVKLLKRLNDLLEEKF